MLAALEERREEKPVAGPPRLVIFQSLGLHIRRVSGLVSHGKAGPRYEIAAEWGVWRAGRLLDRAPWFDRLPREIALRRHSLHALDSHPNAAANALVADYIVRQLVQD